MEEYQKEISVFKAFCDESRLRILRLLQGGEHCACELLEQLSISQPTLSHHLKIMTDSGVVKARKVGKWMYYSISESGSAFALSLLIDFTTVRGSHKIPPCCREGL